MKGVRRFDARLSHTGRRSYDHRQMRYLEISLFLAPFVLFAAWRLTSPGLGLSPRLVAASAAAVVLLLAALLWFHREGSLPSGSAYVPAKLEDGRIVPAHGAPR
jgi:hypothetical protein